MRKALAGTIAGDAGAWTFEAAELLDVDVQQFARLVTLVAPHRLGRLGAFRVLRPRWRRTRQKE